MRPTLKIAVLEQAFDPWAEAQRFQAELGGGFGATAMFIGTMRDFNDGEQVSAMELEYYPGMTERMLEQSLNAVAVECEIIAGLLMHRVGLLIPGEPIVLVVVWTAHRGSAFAACRHLVEELKSKAPFWKKETRRDGERWVEHNTPP